ncbi:glycosyltransferase family 4 protein [Candidatus Kaiserbacteria bacterium]|nr:glycosyltransferase family 4 protein [Candidatus Kaiserbacteria bacterium]
MQSSKLRIAFFGDDFARGGKGTALVIQKIAEELAIRDDVDLSLLRPEGKCNSPLCEKARTVIIKRFASTLLSYAFFFLTHRETYDAVIFNRVVYPLFWMLSAKKKVVFIHDASRSEVYRSPRSLVNLAFEYFLRFVGQYFFTSAIAVSEDAKKWIISYYALPPSKVHTIYNAAEKAYRRYSEEERIVARERLLKTYGIRPPYILSVARFDPHKNNTRIVEAFIGLRKEGVPHTLVCIGGAHAADYSREVEEKIRQAPEGSVHVEKYVANEDMPALYNCAEMLVFPSLVEGFGLPIVEAMQCGTPVLTSNISCMPEIAGGAAVLTDPLDVDAIQSRMRQLVNDFALRERIAAKGLARARDFSWRKSAEALLHLIRNEHRV